VRTFRRQIVERQTLDNTGRSRLTFLVVTGIESVPIQLAQCRFPGKAISNAKILIYFSNKIYGRSFFYQTALGNCNGLISSTVVVGGAVVRGGANVRSWISTSRPLVGISHSAVAHSNVAAAIADCSLRKEFYCVIYYNFRHTFVPYSGDNMTASRGDWRNVAAEGQHSPHRSLLEEPNLLPSIQPRWQPNISSCTIMFPSVVHYSSTDSTQIRASILICRCLRLAILTFCVGLRSAINMRIFTL